MRLGHAHFGKFVGILEDYLATKAADTNFNPVRPIEPAYFRLPADVESGTLIEDPLTAPGGRTLQRPLRGDPSGPLPVLRSSRRDPSPTRHFGSYGQAPDELGAARGRLSAHDPADRPFAPWSHSRSDPGHCPPRLLCAAPPEPAWKIINERLDTLTETCASLAQQPALSRRPSGKALFDGGGLRCASGRTRRNGPQLGGTCWSKRPRQLQPRAHQGKNFLRGVVRFDPEGRPVGEFLATRGQGGRP